MPLALLIGGIGLWKDRDKRWAVAGFAAGLMMLYMLIYVKVYAP